MTTLWGRICWYSHFIVEDIGTERLNNLPNITVGKVLEGYSLFYQLKLNFVTLGLRSTHQTFFITISENNFISWLNKHVHMIHKTLTLYAVYSAISYSFGLFVFFQILVVIYSSNVTIHQWVVTGNVETIGLVGNVKRLRQPSRPARWAKSQVCEAREYKDCTQILKCKYLKNILVLQQTIFKTDVKKNAVVTTVQKH